MLPLKFRYKYYVLAAVVVLVFWLVPPIVVSRLGFSELQTGVLLYVVLSLDGLTALLLLGLIVVRLVRALIALNSALVETRSGRFTHLDAALAPAFVAPVIENFNAMSASLEAHQRELHDEVGRTALLTRLSLELRETLEEETIVRHILAAIDTNTDAERASLVLVGADGAFLLGHESTGVGIQAISQERGRRMLERGAAGWALRNSRHLLIGDVSRDERWVDSAMSLAGSAMVLPISHGHTALGVLTIAHSTSDHFTGQDLVLLEGVASQASIAINSARRKREEQRYREQALLLFSMSQFLTSERSAGDLAHELLLKCDDVFGAAHTALYLIDQTNGQLELFASRGVTPHTDEALVKELAAIAQQPLRSRHPVTSPLMVESPNHPLMGVALPMMHNGITIGVFVLAQPGEGSAVLPARLWSMLTTFTNVIAAAFANVQLVEQLRDRAQKLDRQIAERTVQLQRSRDLLRVILDNLPDGLLLMDNVEQILTANGAFCWGVLGVSPQSVVGRLYANIMEDATVNAQLRIEPQPTRPGPNRVRVTDGIGQVRWYEIDRYTFKTSNNEEQTVERWRDVTTSEEMHRKLMLHQQLTSLGHLAASVVHEIGNPLQSVRICLDLCREDAGQNPEMTEYLSLAYDELVRIERLLDYLRDVYSAPGVVWSPVDINQLVEDAQTLARGFSQNESNTCELVLELTPNLPEVHGQADALRQVLVNLIFHARETMPQGGLIQITTFPDEARGMSCIRVADNGNGISAARLATIYKPFNSQRAQSPGLGLYLSRQVIQQHQGTIAISSEAGEGTEVIVGLPWQEKRRA